MIPAIRSELRKLFTVRSTYVIILLCLAVTVFFAFYISGYHAKVDVTERDLVANEMLFIVQPLSLFISLVAILHLTHEYRYNTIMYTLTAARRRTQVLLAKILVISVFAILLALLVCALVPLLTQLGVHAKGLSIVPQSIPFQSILGRTTFYSWGNAMLALLFSFIIRSQVGAIAFILLFPGPGEGLLGLLLKDNAKYLPFRALGGVLQGTIPPDSSLLQSGDAAKVLMLYLVIGWLVAWLLFLRRDAN